MHRRDSLYICVLLPLTITISFKNSVIGVCLGQTGLVKNTGIEELTVKFGHCKIKP